MLVTADSLWKYIDSFRNIYCLPLQLFYYFENWDKQILFWHSQLFAYFTCCPFIPICSYTTSIRIAPSTMAAGDERCGKGNK